jgi:eukaryotic-like serine/threonine-protein kinase
VIQVGEVLDKYELLERVGQGGMAIVYRGLDRALKRVVAIKILHKHLADYQEARDRFEREAQAVAKLRHENILEIFDYSGADAAKAAGSSYIVTEFIDGRTLKQATVDRPIQFPEIGAMIMLQVGHALAHAHAHGILHRDVKPENIMVRADGVVKLMDFGISHMVDLERLTVTGQLLGSPAYMAPEHVEGRPLDFRTDVFAAGIVLYQLTVGKLPFEGKNPHEVLKRIAECKFLDPRQANPQIGNRLGRIILRAMAAAPADRFANVGEMVLALVEYLEESGLPADKVTGELARYFAAPVPYEQALETRLVEHLTTRGSRLLATADQAAALDVFDRVLTIDPDNARVLGILDRVNRRRRLRRLAGATAAFAVTAGCAYAIHRRAQPDLDAPPPTLEPAQLKIDVIAVRNTLRGRDVVVAPLDVAPPPDATPVAIATPATPDAGVDAAAAIAEPALARIIVAPASNSEVQVGDGDWQAVGPDGALAARVAPGSTIRARNKCCGDESTVLHAGQTEVTLLLRFKAGFVVVECDEPIDAKIEGTDVKLGQKFQVFFDESLLDSKTVTVELGGAHPEQRRVAVRSGKTETVRCAPR